MSSHSQPTRERILDCALALFNEKGIEGVGMRDIAHDLNLSPGNLTYHFSKKEDVIIGIAERLSEQNSRSHMAANQPESFSEFLAMVEEIFYNHYQFRCLLLSIVQINEQYPGVAERYQGVQTMRREAFREKLMYLRATGRLREDITTREVERMADYCTLIGRFWLSEYWISHRDRPVEEMIAHYLDLLAGVFLPYATPLGYAELTSPPTAHLSSSMPKA